VARAEERGAVVKKPTKKQLASIPLFTEQEEQEHALFDAVMGVFDKLKPSNITVVRTMMKIAASGAVYGKGNAAAFVVGARKAFEEAVENIRRSEKAKETP
jgi:hypothetical protein